MPSRLAAFSTRPSLLLKNAFDVLLFEFQKSQTGVEERCADLSVTVEVKIVECDVLLVTQQHGAFDYVTQFANVAGP